jgi:hypothetical protein
MTSLAGDRGFSNGFSNNRTAPPFRLPHCGPNRRPAFSRTFAYFLSAVVTTVVHRDRQLCAGPGFHSLTELRDFVVLAPTR